MAAAASMLLGATLLVALAEVIVAVPYVAVLVVGAAALAVGAALLLWVRETLLTRVVARLAATVPLAIVLLHVAVGLPGTRAVEGVSLLEGGLILVLSGSVLVVLAVGAARHRPVEAPDHPYAL